MYNPDKWIILKIKGSSKVIYKVLAGWSGSYLDGQSWKINSGIVKVSQEGDFYLFEGHSGSVYKCHKNSYGTNTISGGVLSGILSDPLTSGKVEVVEDQDFNNLLNK